MPRGSGKRENTIGLNALDRKRLCFRLEEFKGQVEVYTHDIIVTLTKQFKPRHYSKL